MTAFRKDIKSHKVFLYWNPIVVVSSIFIIISITIETLGQLDKYAYKFLFDMDLLVSLIFMADFFICYYYSVNRRKFVKSEWFYLLVSLPFAHLAHWLMLEPTIGLLLFLQIVRLLRSARGLEILVRILTVRRVTSILSVYALYLTVTLYFSSLAFYTFERSSNPNVHGYFDALWWSFITVTTVGYGDIAPVTVAGRVIAIVLILGGMGLFSIITAYLSSKFLAMHGQETHREGGRNREGDLDEK